MILVKKLYFDRGRMLKLKDNVENMQQTSSLLEFISWKTSFLNETMTQFNSITNINKNMMLDSY